MGTMRDVYELLDGVMYNSHSSSRNSDTLNKALLLIGGSAISNGSNIWSCLRGISHRAWYAHGYLGFFYHYSLCYTNQAVPLSLVKLA